MQREMVHIITLLQGQGDKDLQSFNLGVVACYTFFQTHTDFHVVWE